MRNKKATFFLNLLTSIILIIGQLGFLPLIGSSSEISPRIVGDDPGISISGPSIIESRQQVELNIHLASSAGGIDEDGKIQISIPHEIVQDESDLLNKLIIGEPFYLDDSSLTKDSQGDYVLTVFYDHTKISQTDAVGYTFTIKFIAPIFNVGDESIPDFVEFPVEFYKGNNLVSSDQLNSEVHRLNNSLPNLSKWSTRPKKIIDGNEVALMSLDKPASNIYAITVNYDQKSMKNVKLTDTIPEGTQLTDPDTYIPAVGDLTPYQHIRIAKVTSRKADGTPNEWKYVTSELSNKITVNNQGFTIDFGDVTTEDSYVVMYGEEILGNPTPAEFGVKNNHAAIYSNDSLVSSYDSAMALDESSYSGISLNKKVEQTTLADTEGILDYTLTLKSSSGSIPAGTVISDPLPDYTTYQTTVSKNDTKVSDAVYDSTTRKVSYTLLDTLEEGESLTIVFNAVYNNKDAQAGDKIINKASINYNGTSIYSNDAVTILDGSAYLTKIASENKNPLAGAVFKVVDSKGQTVLENLVSDSSGKVNTGLLPPGDYQFIETQAPENYAIDPTPVSFTVVSGQEVPVVLSKTNSLDTGGVVLTKTDDQSGEGLAGAVFELQDKEGKKLQSGLTTDASGKLAIDELAPGEYQLVETKAPTGYDLDKKPVSFTIEKGQTEAVEVTKTNHLTPGGVVLTKTDDQSGEGLAGAVFELQDKEGKKLQSGLTTDASGKLSIDELAPGEYQLVETKAPTGYDLDKKPVSFTIEKGQTEAVEVTKTNTRKANSILLEKIDSQSGEKLANASFMIKDQKGKIVQKNLKTDSSGHLSIEGLPEGSYELIETKAPEGYILDDRPIAFNISKRNESVELTKENDPKKVNQKTDESFPKTGEQRQPLLVLFGVLILILFFGFLTYIVINKKKKR
ncbi:hypothetical protein IGL24_000636 [Enterococcus sp. DIV2371]|uniref:SpaA isopeptide-forming pilin-related protein n=1 Tax=Enterococcus sp. DIV2371 TaxID=2774927 RepID=UPI003D29B4BD